MERKRRLEITDGWCKAVRPEASAVDYFDARQRGLVFRVERSGVRTWAVRYRFEGRGRRYKVGTYPETGVKAARDHARRVLGTVAAGNDPALERERVRIGQTVEAVVEAWLADERLGPGARWKGGTEGGTARAYLPHVRAFVERFGTHKLAAMAPADVERFVSSSEAPATRNRRLQAVRLVAAWAKRKGIIGADPSRGLTKELETARARVLTDDELGELVRGFDGTRFGRAVRLLALTGLRRDEVLGAAWSWLDSAAAVLTIPAEAEKTGARRGEPRRVALSPQALAILTAQREAQLAEGLRSESIFTTSTGARPHHDALKPVLNRLRGLRSNGLPASSDKRAKARRAALPEDVTIHDLRRTVAHRLLNELGAAPWVVDHVVLGHARPKLLRTYMPVLPLDEARAALTRWAERLEAIVAGVPAAGRQS